MQSLGTPVLLLALLGLGLGAAAAATSVAEPAPPRRDPVAALRRWLSDEGARKNLLDVWGENEQPLFNAYHAYNVSTKAASDPAYQRCVDDIQYVLDTQALWSLQMLDASVKVPEGLLAYVTTHLGNWDECVAVRDVPRRGNGEGTFHGQMCMVTLGANLEALGQRNLEAAERQLLEAASLDTGSLSVLAYAQLLLGACVPSSCSAHHVQTLFQQMLFPGDPEETNKYPIMLTVNDNSCTTEERPPFEASDWVAVGILSVLGLLLVLSTAYDVVTPPERKVPLLISFSVTTNGRKLLAAPRDGGDQTLASVHGIRFLSMCWVVLGHRYLYSNNYPNVNPMFYLNVIEDPWRVGITNATVSVDTFFMLSGLLVGYVFFKQPHSKRKLNLPMYYIHRYIRLTPAFAFMILVNATLIARMGWGPMWQLQTESTRQSCQTCWWSSLLYLQNFIHPTDSCVGQGWYLMVDMQLYWLAPLLLIPMARWPRAGFAATGALIVAGIVGVFVESMVLDLPGNVFASSDVDVTMKYFEYYYIATYARYTPYLLGLCLGYFLGNSAAEGTKLPSLGRVVACLAWLSVAALLLVPLFTGYPFLQTPLPDKVPTAFFNALNRPAWALGVAGVAYLCASGYGGPVNHFLSWSGFQVLGRLSYCVYLVHFSVQLTEIASARTYTYMADGAILANFASDLLVSFLLAGVLSLATEAPFMALEKQLLGRARGGARGGARQAGVEAGVTSGEKERV